MFFKIKKIEDDASKNIAKQKVIANFDKMTLPLSETVQQKNKVLQSINETSEWDFTDRNMEVTEYLIKDNTFMAEKHVFVIQPLVLGMLPSPLRT